jgi:hypothetical protein
MRAPLRSVHFREYLIIKGVAPRHGFETRYEWPMWNLQVADFKMADMDTMDTMDTKDHHSYTTRTRQNRSHHAAQPHREERRRRVVGIGSPGEITFAVSSI